MNKIITTSLIAVSLVLSILAITKEPVQIDVPKGAVSGPDISSPYFSYGGARHWGAKTDTLTQGTTTVCAIQAPASTSTLTFASIQLSVSSSTQSRVVIAKATTPYATTTVLGSAVFAANAQGTLIATSTPVDALNEDKTFAPNTWLVVGMQGGIGTFSPTGTCLATWVEN